MQHLFWDRGSKHKPLKRKNKHIQSLTDRFGNVSKGICADFKHTKGIGQKVHVLIKISN